MGIQQPNLRAHTILDSTSGKAYYVLVTLLEDRTEFEESSINLRVTDGSSCWGREGTHHRAVVLCHLCCPLISCLAGQFHGVEIATCCVVYT